MDSSSPSPGSADEPIDDQRARADAAIRAIADGADPGAEAFRLSNEFTDDAMARWSAALRRRFGRAPRS